jgi:adenosylcobinamide-phosphate synthase
MTCFLALLAALVLAHFFPWRGRAALLDEVATFAGSVRRRLDAGDTTSGAVALTLWLALALVPLGILHFALLAEYALFAFFSQVGLLYVLLNFWPVSHALQDATLAAAKRTRAEPDEDSAIARKALADVYYETLAPLIWYALLPGPLGLVLYFASRWAALYWRTAGAFGEPAAQLFHVLDWLPQRATALVFAVMGDFEDAMFAARTSAGTSRRQAADQPPQLAIAAAAGALDLQIRTGESQANTDAGADTVGQAEASAQSEPLSAEGLQAVGALIWRSMAVVLVVLLLIGVGRVL